MAKKQVAKKCQLCGAKRIVTYRIHIAGEKELAIVCPDCAWAYISGVSKKKKREMRQQKVD
jgi:hypothetical protein